jgi:hypothetical protein
VSALAATLPADHARGDSLHPPPSALSPRKTVSFDIALNVHKKTLAFSPRHLVSCTHRGEGVAGESGRSPSEYMNAQQVRKLVENEIADGWAVTNHHHVDLRRALIQPRKIMVIERTVKEGQLRDRTVAVWLVLVERPETEDGYRIVMKEDEPVFGLACGGFPEDEHLVLCGWYGDFMTTFRAM